MNVDDIRTNPFRHFGLVFQFLDRFFHDIGPRRIQDHELIRMKTGSEAMMLGKSTAVLKSPDDFFTIRKIRDLVAACGMCFDGQDLTVDPKAADLVFRAILQCGQ